jgi:dsRNA-specific ribonuclease
MSIVENIGGVKSTKDLLKLVRKNMTNLSRTEIDNSVTVDFKDIDFKMALIKLLTERGGVDQAVATKLLDEKGLQIMKIAFTHPSMLEVQNYELYETLGDSTLNKCIVWYLTRRFPQIKYNPSGNEIITELKKTAVSKGSYSKHFDALKLTSFIRYKKLPYTMGEKQLYINIDNSMKEDVFEAMMGALEDLIDSKIMVGTGYAVIYNIITSILDTIYISIDLNEIIDAKTKLNEVVGQTEKKYGKIKNDDGTWTATLQINFRGIEANFTGKPDRQLLVSEQNAAQQALDKIFKDLGIKWERKSMSLI